MHCKWGSNPAITLINCPQTTNQSSNKSQKLFVQLTAAESSYRAMMSQHVVADGEHHGANENGDELGVSDLRPMTVTHREAKSRLKKYSHSSQAKHDD